MKFHNFLLLFLMPGLHWEYDE